MLLRNDIIPCTYERRIVISIPRPDFGLYLGGYNTEVVIELDACDGNLRKTFYVVICTRLYSSVDNIYCYLIHTVHDSLRSS